MAKDSITLEEYNWTRKVCKECSLEFDKNDDEPVPEGLADQCRQKLFELNRTLPGTLSNYDYRMSVVRDEKQIKYFDALQQDCKECLSAANEAWATDDLPKTVDHLDQMEALLESMKKFIEQIWFPVDYIHIQTLDSYKEAIEKDYKTVNKVPDKAAKREFEARYQPIINLIAETEDLMSGQGESAEEEVIRNLEDLKAQIEQTKPLVMNALLAADSAKEDPKPAETKEQTGSLQQQDLLLKAAADFCENQQEAIMRRINDLLAQEGCVHDQVLKASFDSYKQDANQINGVISQLLQMNKIDSAGAELKLLDNMATKLQGCIDEANSRDRQKANAYRKTLQKARKTMKKLATGRAKILDPDKSEEYTRYLTQIEAQISKIGSTLASRQTDRIQLAEQALPRLDELIGQTQELYDETIAAQQLEE